VGPNARPHLLRRLCACTARAKTHTLEHVHKPQPHLQELLFIQVLAHKLDDLGSHNEVVAHILVANEVEVALAVARLLHSRECVLRRWLSSTHTRTCIHAHAHSGSADKCAC